MSQAPGSRDKERTRRAILTAGAQLYRELGTGVSLARVAEAAGVSKGGLLHHFPDREALESALVQHVADELWREVTALVDIADNRPGKLMRAYVRALTSPGRSGTIAAVFEPASVFGAIQGRLELTALLAADAERWRGAFARDGLNPTLTLVVRAAAEGLSASVGTPYLTSAELDLASSRLIELTLAPNQVS